MEELLDAGIDVHTTVNIQHLESLSDKVRPALTNFFRTENLTALRALALREIAEQEERHLLGPEPAKAATGRPWASG